MTTAAQRIDALMAIHPKGYDLSLDRITRLLERLGNPHEKLPPVIHVAGTNGKGSAIAFTRAILEANGLSVHTHTSPHLVNWHERYRLGRSGLSGALVEDDVLSEAIGRAADANGGQAITVFEVLTAVAFLLFSEHPADVCLMEVGLGGRFDCTNVMTGIALSVITPISLDHEAYLGDTLAKIAFEKAGIIRRKTPVIVAPQQSEALAVIEQQAGRNLAPILVNGEHFHCARENGRMVFQDETALLDLPLPRLPGLHQIDNAATAIAAVRAFCQKRDIPLSEEAIATGLQNVDWPGRMQCLPDGSLKNGLEGAAEIWLDGGHNPGAAAMIATQMADLEDRDPRPLVMICGMLNTKDPAGYFREFTSLVERLVTVPLMSSDAGLSAEELAKIAQSANIPAQAASSLTHALALVQEGLDTRAPPRILISGSLYLVGDALEQNGTPPQ